MTDVKEYEKICNYVAFTTNASLYDLNVTVRYTDHRAPVYVMYKHSDIEYTHELLCSETSIARLTAHVKGFIDVIVERDIEGTTHA